jgi:hypothetical protein
MGRKVIELGASFFFTSIVHVYQNYYRSAIGEIGCCLY